MFQKKNEKCFKRKMRTPKRLIDLKAWCPLSFLLEIVSPWWEYKKNTKNSIKSKNYLKSKTLREPENLDIDWLVYCYKAKCTVPWAEEHIRKDVCRLNSKLASTTNTQIEFS